MENCRHRPQPAATREGGERTVRPRQMWQTRGVHPDQLLVVIAIIAILFPVFG